MTLHVAPYQPGWHWHTPRTHLPALLQPRSSRHIQEAAGRDEQAKCSLCSACGVIVEGESSSDELEGDAEEASAGGRMTISTAEASPSAAPSSSASWTSSSHAPCCRRSDATSMSNAKWNGCGERGGRGCDARGTSSTSRDSALARAHAARASAGTTIRTRMMPSCATVLPDKGERMRGRGRAERRMAAASPSKSSRVLQQRSRSSSAANGRARARRISDG